ncbi:MAG TPA: hypothetical protein VK171_14080 [Fimbriimonas sp.]|nr:hypothetical protein [Fimbriimonas sp.]
MKHIHFVLPFVGLIAIVGCGDSKDVPAQAAVKKPEPKKMNLTADNQQTLYPLTEGSSWVYTMELERQLEGKQAERGQALLEYRVTKSFKESATATRATVEVYRNDVMEDTQEWYKDNSGVYQVSVGKDKRAYSPPQYIVKFPVKDQEEYTWKGTGTTPVGKRGELSYVFKCEGFMNADTDMGAMHSVFISSSGSFKAGDGQEGIIATNSWFAQDIGLIRYRQMVRIKGGQSTITLKLKSYTVK